MHERLWTASGRLAALVALAWLGGCAPAPGSGEPQVRLFETVPVETALGNPDIPAAADVWVELIRNAKRSLDFEHFYLSAWPGEPLDDVLAAIGEAAERGVRVRILLDARMHGTYPEPADSIGGLEGIDVRRIDMGAIAGGVQHAKYFIVDGETVVLGSQNLDWRALKHIHELGLVIHEPRTAQAFQRVYEMDWAAAGVAAGGDGAADDAERAQLGARMRMAGLEALRDLTPDARAWPVAIAQAPGDTVEVWPSYSPLGFIPDSSLWDRDAIVRLLDAARHEVVIQLLSYAIESYGDRDTTLDDALRRAAARGVQVRMLLSDWQADGPKIEDLKALSAVPNVQARLMHVPEWSGGYIPFARVQHCKFVVVDTSRTWIGTSNWGPGYFTTSRNLAVVLRHRGLAQAVRRTFETSWTDPNVEPVSPEGEYAPRVHGETPPAGVSMYGG